METVFFEPELPGLTFGPQVSAIPSSPKEIELDWPHGALITLLFDRIGR